MVDLRAEAGRNFGLEERRVAAKVGERREDGWLFDFGEECVGRARVRASGAAEFVYGEDRTEALREENYREGWFLRQVDRVEANPVEAGSATGWLEGPRRRAFRWLRVMGSNLDQPPTAEAIVEHYPTPPAARFACSDPLLERAWAIAERTTRLCMQQWYEDGIKRDGLLWTGDYRIQFLCNAVLFGDRDLARKSLACFAVGQFPDGRVPACAIRAGARQPQNIPYMPGCHDDDGTRFLGTWTLWNYDVDYLLAVEEYGRYTGDLEFVRALYPSVVRCADALATLRSNEARWGPAGEFLTDLHPDHEGWWGSRGALAAAQVQGLAVAGEIAAMLGEPSRWASAERELRDHLSRFACPEGGFADDPGARCKSRHATARAMLVGQASSESLLRFDPDAPLPQTGYGIHFWLEALFRAGHGDLALGEIRRYWGTMLAQDATTCWDAVDPRLDHIARPDTHAMSHCHGWSATVAFQLIHGMLGVRPLSPGWERVEVRPNLSGVAWATASIPTPLGPLEVEVRGDRTRVSPPPRMTVVTEKNPG